ncbi:MAG: DUF4198 domain-containing protein [Paracoccaceae bacterium]|nr:DUF4198 domain-containing protein [Paracoccaceae bacterium]
MFQSLKLTALLACIALPAKAHEFWIDPEAFVVSPGDEIVADLRVGEGFKGSPQTFLPPRFRRFDFVLDGRTEDVPGRIGDRPALTMPAPGDGLLVLVHETTNQSLTWSAFRKFESFARHKDAAWAVDEHLARGWPEEGFREIYSRYAKSLVGVGSSQGADRQVGLLTELVALENPYTGGAADGLEVLLLFEGEPRPDAQIEIFQESSDGSVEISTTRTDETGRAAIQVLPGKRYMLDAVVLRSVPQTHANNQPLWESLWANLTFAVPGE